MEIYYFKVSKFLSSDKCPTDNKDAQRPTLQMVKDSRNHLIVGHGGVGERYWLATKELFRNSVKCEIDSKTFAKLSKYMLSK